MNISWPGLNSPLMAKGKMLDIEKLPPNENRLEELVALRNELGRIRYRALPPLLRGYTGKKFPGTSRGPPDPIGDCK